MSDNSTAGPVQSTATVRGALAVPGARRPHPIAMILVDVVTGTVRAANPAGRRKLAGSSGLQLSRWLCELATGSAAADGGDALDDPARRADVTTVRAWQGVDGASAQPVMLWAQCTPVEFRSHPCLLVALREDDVPAGADPARPLVDPTAAAFTLDAVGRIDSWGRTAQRLTGFAADVVLGSDTTLLHPAPSRLAGDPHRALTDAYRSGEHRAEGWRVRSDGRCLWAEVVTCALYDGLDRLVGFGATMRDLTVSRRLTASSASRVPTPRPAPVDAPVVAPVDAPGRPAAALRVPVQRRPANS